MIYRPGIMKFIMVFFLIFVFFDLCPAEDLSQPVITEDEPVLGRQETPDKQGAVVLKSKITYEASVLRDPFKKYSETDISQPQESGAPVLPEMTVSGIIWGTAIPQAIINDKVVKIGDTIDEVKIININKDFISVVFSGCQYKLDAPASAGNINKTGGGEQ
jgi:hypothetical protein